MGMNTPIITACEPKDEQEVLRKIVWVTAMLECEGTFTFQYNKQCKNGKIHSHIQPRVIFVNSDISLVDAVETEVLRLTSLTPYRKYDIKCGMGKRPKTSLTYCGFKCLPFLEMVRPFMVGSKSEVVDCMISFIGYRQSLDKPKQIYGDFEFDLLRRVKKINSGNWNIQPKFSSISTSAVLQRRESTKRSFEKLEVPSVVM